MSIKNNSLIVCLGYDKISGGWVMWVLTNKAE